MSLSISAHLMLSTLLPYTTLFRSGPEEWFDGLEGAGVVHRLEGGGGLVDHLGQACQQGTVQRLDRKSTRLNSSHVAISYAVFCLKKKTEVADSCSFITK